MVETSVADVSQRGNAISVAGIWTRNACMIATTATIACESKRGWNGQAVNDVGLKTCSRKWPSQKIQEKPIWLYISIDNDNGSLINFGRLLVFSSIFTFHSSYLILKILYTNNRWIRVADVLFCHSFHSTDGVTYLPNMTHLLNAIIIFLQCSNTDLMSLYIIEHVYHKHMHRAYFNRMPN